MILTYSVLNSTIALSYSGGVSMKTVEDLEKEIWEQIESATKERNSTKIAHLNSMATRVATIKGDLEKIEGMIYSDLENIPGQMNDYTGLDLPPEGTECRFSYRNKTYEGNIKNDVLNISGYGNFKSFSGASVKITNTSRNGWRDWEIRLPGDTKWILADVWRRRRKSNSF